MCARRWLSRMNMAATAHTEQKRIRQDHGEKMPSCLAKLVRSIIFPL